MINLSLDGLPGPIAIAPGLKAMVDDLRTILVGWPVAGDDAMPTRDPFITATGRPDAVLVRRVASGEERMEPSTTSAVCTIVVELMAAFVGRAPGLGNLHAGAVEINGRLVLFPATNRAGKSTLVCALGARGHRVFADDLLPIDLDTLEAVASGCLPRLRLPLPDSAPPELRRLADGGSVVSDGYYAYLSAGAGDVAHGARGRIGAIVLIERSERPVSASLETAPLDETLLRVLSQDTKADAASDRLFDRYLSLAEQASVERLVYSDIGEAVARLEQAYSAWPADTVAPARPLVGAAPSDPAVSTAAATLPKGAGVYRRSGNVSARIVGESAFLVDTTNNEIHHLNTLGLGVWNLLEQPVGEPEIIEIVGGAYPDMPAEVVRNDVGALLQRFEQAGLIERD